MHGGARPGFLSWPGGWSQGCSPCSNRHNGNGVCSSSNSNSISCPFILYHFLHAFMTKFLIEEKNNVKVFHFQGAFNKNNQRHFYSIHLQPRSSDAVTAGAGGPPHAHQAQPRPLGWAWVLGLGPGSWVVGRGGGLHLPPAPRRHRSTRES